MGDERCTETRDTWGITPHHRREHLLMGGLWGLGDGQGGWGGSKTERGSKMARRRVATTPTPTPQSTPNPCHKQWGGKGCYMSVAGTCTMLHMHTIDVFLFLFLFLGGVFPMGGWHWDSNNITVPLHARCSKGF
jgi:hypothetical protein